MRYYISKNNYHAPQYLHLFKSIYLFICNTIWAIPRT